MSNENQKLDRAEELKQELHALRSNFERIIERYSLNVKAQIEEIIEILEQKRENDEKVPVPKSKELEVLISKIQKLKLKPEKGRKKDLNRIQRVLGELASVFQI